MPPPVVLASSSPYRRDLLARLGIPFTCDSPDVDEGPRAGERPADTARRLARDKARKVAKRHPGSIVIGSDQTMESGGSALGKPGTREALDEMLRTLAGKGFALHTAVCIIGPEGEEERLSHAYEGSVRALTPEEIGRYAETGEALDCAGGMKVEGLGIALLEGIRGQDPTGIIGLPLAAVSRVLDRMGVLFPE